MANGAVAMYRIYDLPWSTGLEDDQKFKRLAHRSVLTALALTFIFWLLPQPQIDPSTVEEVPKRLVRLVLEREAPPPPPPAPAHSRPDTALPPHRRPTP